MEWLTSNNITSLFAKPHSLHSYSLSFTLQHKHSNVCLPLLCHRFFSHVTMGHFCLLFCLTFSFILITYTRSLLWPSRMINMLNRKFQLLCFTLYSREIIKYDSDSHVQIIIKKKTQVDKEENRFDRSWGSNVNMIKTHYTKVPTH